MKYLKIYFKKYKTQSILAPLFKMLEAAFDLIVPLVVAKIINVGIAEKNKNYILSHFAILILMAVLGLLCSYVAQYFAAKTAIGTATGLRHDLLKHISGLDFSKSDQIGASTLVTRMTSDVNQVQNGLNMFLRLFLRSPFIVFGAMIMAFSINKQISLVFVVSIPVLFAVVFGIMYITNPMYKKTQSRLDSVTVSTRENLTGVRVVRAFGRETEELQNFKNLNSRLEKIQIKVGNISAVMNPITYVIVNMGIIAILWFGSQKVNGGILFPGDIIALVNYLSQILVELIKLANLVVQLSKSVVSMQRIEAVFKTKNEMLFGDVSSEKNNDDIIKFEHVGFCYNGSSEKALDDINFVIKRGQTVGIIGGTGSGKTTLINLIARFYDATSGKIFLGGEPIALWDKYAIRKKIAVVMQKNQLFSGTVKDNLRYGNPKATEEEIWEALRLARASEFIEKKPKQLDYFIEQGGRNLSGGQKQRLCVARALISRSDILILDDSMSALDYATDAALRRSLNSLNDTTVIIVSQRTSSIQHADEILVLDDGKLVGCGRHDDLLKSCDVYKEINDSTSKKEGE